MTTLVTNTTTATGDTGWVVPGATPAGSWTASSGTVLASVATNDNVYLRTSTNGTTHQWGTFGLTSGGSPLIPSPGSGQSLSIVGMEVRLSDAFVSAACANSNIKVETTWNNGGTWSTQIASTPALTTTTTADYTVPSTNGSTSTAAWGGHSWVRGDFTDANFKLRLTATKGCATAGTTLNLDQLQVRVYWSMDTTTTTSVTTTTPLTDKNLQGPGTSCTNGAANCNEADGSALNPRGFWATMNTEGAENANGDAFQPYYDTATSTPAGACTAVGSNTACYDADTYYNYAVEMPAGSTGGSVWVYDPVFCDVSVSKGTGDRWFSGTNPVSSFFELYNTQNTLYDNTDDTQLATSGSLFKQISASDTTMGGSGGSECKYWAIAPYGDGRDYHNRWYRLYTGLTGGANGTIYRLHTTSTDPTNVTDQRNTNGESTFALYASASGGAPRIYGLGAMQMFTPLSASGGTVSSEFYLAQIDAVHAGKTMEIKLWDPGDTNPLAANLQIEIPTSGGWAPTPSTGRPPRGPRTRMPRTATRSLRERGVVGPDQRRTDDRHVQRLLADDRRRHPDHLHRAAERLVEDQVQHDRDRHLERRDDLARPDPWQPRSSHRPLILSDGGPPTTIADSHGPAGFDRRVRRILVRSGTVAMALPARLPTLIER